MGTELIDFFGAQLRILEMYCPFVMQQESDIYQWLLDDSNVELVCGSLLKLEVFMCQAFPHHMKRYMNGNKLNELKERFKNKFREYRKKNGCQDIENIPLILFDFGMDLNKTKYWIKPDIKQYLIENQKRLELNFGEGI